MTLLRNIRNSFRLLLIAFILARHNALFVLEEAGISPILLLFCRPFARRGLHARPGKRLAAALETMGPSFIKLGQALSIRADIVGDDIAEDLSSLQDRLPPFPGPVAREIITRELGRPLEELYTAFEDKAVAAASIAQVHYAVTADGKEVAVKILRPEIEKAFARDLELFLWLAEMLERRLPHWRRLKPIKVIETFKESVDFELDLRLEAAAATELKENTSKDVGFKVPAIDWQRTSARVMTMERIDGIPISDVTALTAAGHDLNGILRKVASAFFYQAFRDGFFHADMHPGNLFVLPNGDIGAVDFGIMGRLDRKTRLYVAEILRGFLNEDYRHVAEIHFTAGYVPPDKSVDNFTLACMAIAKPILDKPLSEISAARLLGQLFKITETFEMETQPQLLLFQKNMVLTEGIGRILNPTINMWEMVRPIIEQWASDNFGPEAKIKAAAENMLHAVKKIPQMMSQVEKTLDMIDEGGIRLHPDTVHTITAQRRYYNQQWLILAWTAFASVLLILFLMR